MTSITRVKRTSLKSEKVEIKIKIKSEIMNERYESASNELN